MTTKKAPRKDPPRVLIEEWLPAAAIGVECMRERGSASALAPTTYLHVWWARRPLCVSRAAVLASLLPADFPRDVFERLLGFGKPGKEIVRIRALMDMGVRVDGGFGCDRAFKANLIPEDLDLAHRQTKRLWGGDITVIDPMSGGGSIPLESARLGFHTLANEYNPVACSVLEATVDYPIRFGEPLGRLAREWGRIWLDRITKRLADYYPRDKAGPIHAYVFTRTVPCPDTGFHTPLVPDWHLMKPKGKGGHVVAVPTVDKTRGTWAVEIRQIGKYAGQLSEKHVPKGSYSGGKGISLFTDRPISSEYIKAKAQAGQMHSALYAVGVKTSQGLEFRPPLPSEIKALASAEKEMERLRAGWEKAGAIPTETYPETTTDERPRLYGMPRWSDMFSPRQLLAAGTMVEELKRLGPEIALAEGHELSQAIHHLLALAIDKMLDYNNQLTTWENTRGIVKHAFQRHDFSFKASFGEMPTCHAGGGLNWAIDNVVSAYEAIAGLPRSTTRQHVVISSGSGTNLPQIGDASVTAVVVDPPYDDNVQYSELADFFYVWLKRTQGHRRPEWFSTKLCQHDDEAVVNGPRYHTTGMRTKDAKDASRVAYRRLMTDIFREAKRVLRDDGVLTVMFTHKKQEAWAALFASLIEAGFRITATWPVKTESEHSLHQARKNAAQSTVLLVARERPDDAGAGYFDEDMRREIGAAARAAAERLKADGLNAVDQLVGSFGPAMAVYSRYAKVTTDTGDPVGVDQAIDLASEAVSAWRVEQLAERGLDDVEPEGRFVALCWDVLGAAEFRFNEAHLLGKAVGMDVATLEAAGLVTKSGDKVQMVPAKDRRRSKALKPEEVEDTLFGPVAVPGKRRRKADVLQVHPNDPRFRTALDACHALALRHIEAGGGAPGVGSARALASQQNWKAGSAVARLMEALVKAAPEGVRHPEDKGSAAKDFPEFAAWHALLKPLFGITPPDWTKREAAFEPSELPFEEFEQGDDEEEEGEEG